MSSIVMVPGVKEIHDGMSRHILEISKRLSKKGFFIVNLLPTSRGKPNLQIVNDSYVLLEIPSVNFHLLRPHKNLIASYFNQAVYYLGYKEAVRKTTADLNNKSILHSHGLYTITQSNNSRFKRLVTFQGFGQLDMISRDRSKFRATLLHSVLKRVYSHGDYYTTFSESMRRMASNLYNIDPSKIALVPHGVDAGAFSTKSDPGRIERIESRYGINKRFRVLFVGHLVRGKGLDIIFRSLKILKGRRSDVQFLLKVGKLAGVTTRKVVGRLGLCNDVRVISDFFGEEDFQALYQLSNAIVNFHMLTGHSTTVLEAMASGIPPMVYNSSPNRELVDDSCGVVLQSLDPEELADKIELLANDSNFSKRLGVNAKSKVAKYYDWDNAVVPGYASVYRNLIDG